MTSDRSQAYGRVMQTLAELGPAKNMADDAAVVATREARSVIDNLVDSGRWSEERAHRLADDLAACGPLAPVA